MNNDSLSVSEICPYKGSTSFLLTKESLIQQAKIIRREDAIGLKAADSLEKIIHKLSISTVADMISSELSHLRQEVVHLEEEGYQDIANELSLLISSSNRLSVQVGFADELYMLDDR